MPPITTKEHVFIPSVLGTFTKIDYRQSNKACVNKFKRSHIIQNKFSGHSGTMLRSNNKKIADQLGAL